MHLSLTFLSLWRKMRAYVKENIAVCVVFVFLLVSGIAAGINIIQATYRQQGLESVTGLPDLFRTAGIPWLQNILLSSAVQIMIACLLLLSGLWGPTVLLWPVAILFRGMLVGAGIGIGVIVWPAHASMVILFGLLLELALLLPPLLRTSVYAMRQFAARCKIKTAPGSAMDDTIYIGLFLKAACGFLPVIILQGVVMPIFLYIFG